MEAPLRRRRPVVVEGGEAVADLAAAAASLADVREGTEGDESSTAVATAVSLSVEDAREKVGEIHLERLAGPFGRPHECLGPHFDSRVAECRSFHRAGVEIDDPILGDPLVAKQIPLHDAISARGTWRQYLRCDQQLPDFVEMLRPPTVHEWHHEYVGLHCTPRENTTSAGAT